MDAPLSSPSLNGPSKNQASYFAASNSSSTQSSGPTSAPQSTQQQSLQPPPQRQVPTDSASPFLRDFNLVAEAAKRAQMAVLMRDLEACSWATMAEASKPERDMRRGLWKMRPWQAHTWCANV
ncbi:hypothetical protein NA56DRAFT_701225 [Hyaloscypha hepaticicola]|uniref:Uncharacterized protein n=1 Tax=Hyaloscypha hepaticicola TaxID=2082293 RepID=A0A2J6QC17_9HELO|nr:hypothetical protein NA56DRAFT_701225 [Hyaloscypha hepaticicola]